ncbi:stage III sporulation protein AG [Shimazuella alba]|jgi:stage III sporulation protein AG|uniref:Stage III sporulation protein AG n=1 Tax=Shimazuella alba TaxID=2690964 RepID=A0A6I4W498_9BACL|nr:stage III sporulation protein AG [Shimazuella alba]MXQ55132.1 stage III sporulation protein AG [Shimazuella alba]
MLQKWLPKQKKWHYLILIGCVGVGILLFSSFLTTQEEDAISNPLAAEKEKTKPTSRVEHNGMQGYEEQFETELSSILSKVVGVSDVSVVVNLDSTEEEVVQSDTRESEQTTNEADTKGGSRSVNQNNVDKKTSVYRTNQGEQPIVIKRLKPRVRGVLVVARGVENLQVRALVIEAVQRILDVPTYRISVLPRG